MSKENKVEISDKNRRSGNAAWPVIVIIVYPCKQIRICSTLLKVKQSIDNMDDNKASPSTPVEDCATTPVSDSEQGAAAAATSGDNSWTSWGLNLFQSAKEKSAEAIGTVRKDLGSFTQSAKEKSAEVIGYVRKDLDEFARTVTDEVSSTTSALKEKLKIEGAGDTVKKGMSSFFSHVSDVFYILPDDEDEPVFFNRIQAKIYALGSDPATFLIDPDNEEFKNWNESFLLQLHQAEVDHYLASNDKLKENHDKLVPAEVSEEMFWSRFMFRIYLIHQEESQRQATRQEAEKRATMPVEEDTKWDEDAEEVSVPQESDPLQQAETLDKDGPTDAKVGQSETNKQTK